MPFGTITANTKTYEPRALGTYSLSTVVFGQAKDEFRLRPVSVGKDGMARYQDIRYVEKDVTLPGGAVVRKYMTVTMSVVVPVDGSFTASDIDTKLSDLDVFTASAIVSRRLAGEI